MKSTKWCLHDALFIGFCAALLVAMKGLLRMKLGLSGHSMLLMTLMYLICLGMIPKVGAITLCGVLTGILSMLVGVGKGGPLLVLKFGVPAIAMDLMLLWGAMRLNLQWRSLVLAFAASTAWALKAGIAALFVGLSWQIVMTKTGISWIQGGFFSLVGALLAPPVIRKLQAHNLTAAEK